ncbi:MAG: sulfatase [Sedimentisphaerales bacterium]|nr:sulfatase [Sedimentisphaerales bacterium]
MSAKPNILFICLDCLRADMLVNSGARTPNLDRLMAQGCLFTNTIAVASLTSPSIASMLTGAYPYEHGIQSLAGYRMNSRVESLPFKLGQMGYHTSAYVSGPLTKELGIAEQFHNYNHRQVSARIFDDFGASLPGIVKSASEPWMTFLHIWELHEVRVPPPEFNHSKYGYGPYERTLSAVDHQLGKLFKEIDLDNTIVVVTGDHGESLAECRVKRFLEWARRKKKLRRWAYWCGTMLDRLRRYVPFGPFDHYSPGFDNHFYGHGFHVYDFLIKVPLMIVGGKNVPAGLRIDRQVSQVDIMPTLLDLLGVLSTESDSTKRGRTLYPLMRSPCDNNWQEHAYTQASGIILLDKTNWILGLRTPDWKYAYTYLASEPKEQLFDLKRDRLELTNVVDRFPHIARRFRSDLEQLIAVQENTKMDDDDTAEISKRLKSLGYL